MTNETYEKLQAELSQLLNTEKYKRMTSKNKDVYKQAILACKSVTSHYKANIETELVKHGRWISDGHHIRCDQCGMYMCDTDKEGDRIPTEFCPNCGARMDGVRNGIVINKNLCDSCITKGCMFQSGIVRSHCDFYNAK